jgi:hypothetical protein
MVWKLFKESQDRKGFAESLKRKLSLKPENPVRNNSFSMLYGLYH